MSIKTFPSQYDVDNNGGNLNSEQNLTSWMTSNVPGIPSTANLCGTASQTNIVGTPGQPSNRRFFCLDSETMFLLSQTGTTVTISGGSIIFEGYLISVDSAQMLNPSDNNYRCSIIVPIEKIESSQPPIKHQPVLATYPIINAEGESVPIPFDTIFSATTIQDSNFIELPILDFSVAQGTATITNTYVNEFKFDLDSIGSTITVGANDAASLQEIIDKTIEMIQTIWGTDNWQTAAVDPDNNEITISLTELASRSTIRSKIVNPQGEEQSGMQYLPFLVQQSEESNQNYELNIGYLPKANRTNKMGVVQINDVIADGVNTGTISVADGILSTTAEVNQNAWSSIGYGTTPAQTSTIASSSKTDKFSIVSDGTISITGSGKTLTMKVIKVPDDSDQTFKSLTLKDTTVAGDTLPNALFNISKSIGGWIVSVNGSEVAKVTINNNVKTISITGDTSVTGNLSTSGNITATGTITGSKIYNAVYNDGAEWYEKFNYLEEFMPGTVIAKVPGSSNRYSESKSSNRRLVVGVCSDSYGHILGGEELDNMEDNNKKFIPVAMYGRVKVRCTGDVEEGDLLIPSESMNGVAERGNIPGMVIGKALESCHTNKNQECTILMQVMNI